MLMPGWFVPPIIIPAFLVLLVAIIIFVRMLLPAA
jgi:hypothetical protein